MGSANEQTSDLGSIHARNIYSKSSGHSGVERGTKASSSSEKDIQQRKKQYNNYYSYNIQSYVFIYPVDPQTTWA